MRWHHVAAAVMWVCVADGPAMSTTDFPAGVWRIEVDGGMSTTYDRDVVGFEGDTACATLANGCVLGKAEFYGGGWHPTILEVKLDRPWHLWATSPSVLGKVTSNGAQFSVTPLSATAWAWALKTNGGYDGVFGTLQFIRP